MMAGAANWLMLIKVGRAAKELDDLFNEWHRATRQAGRPCTVRPSTTIILTSSRPMKNRPPLYPSGSMGGRSYARSRLKAATVPDPSGVPRTGPILGVGEESA
jgi:hypothetical protein